MNWETEQLIHKTNQQMIDKGYNKEVKGENLKLPLCPKCNKTDNVREMSTAILLVARITYFWFECTMCEVRWNARDGIRTKDHPEYEQCVS